MLPGTLGTAKPNPKYLEMEERLAREMSRMKFDTEKQKVEIDRI